MKEISQETARELLAACKAVKQLMNGDIEDNRIVMDFVDRVIKETEGDDQA